MIKEALSKLNKKRMDYCTTMSAVIVLDREEGSKSNACKDQGESRGYLECLKDMGVITGNEMMELYLWFCDSKKIQKDNADANTVPILAGN